MNFWAAQEKAKKRTMWMLIAFTLMTIGVAAIAELVLRAASPDYEQTEFPYLAGAFIFFTFVVALFNYAMYSSQGGSYVAETVGAYKIPPHSTKQHERQLLNIIEEIALAAGIPMPAVYVLENDQINAFAAGTTPENACICVTTGSLQKLNRDELQGVIAHEFGHIYNGDVRISMRLAAMLMGFFVLLYVALRIMQFTPMGRNSDRRNPTALIALILVAAGALSYLAGKILSCMISREREYLADACSVQFTRNPDGIAGALNKIERDSEVESMPKTGMAFSHLYFNDESFLSQVFATHPPLKKRIQAILGGRYLTDEKKLS